MKYRPLNTFELLEEFLEKTLEIKLTKSKYSIVPQLVSTELSLLNFDKNLATKTSKSYRNLFHRDDSIRMELRERIVGELLTMKRLEKEEKIKLGVGGIIPNTTIKQDAQAFILLGLPASGKSSIANEIADNYGAYVLDSDYAKRKLPEFKSVDFGASLVHDESQAIIFGEDGLGFKSVFEHITDYRLNCVIPKIGSNLSKIEALINLLKEYKYKIHLTLIELDRKKATVRALYRYKETKRYVPLALIYDNYGNQPTITYYKIKSKLNSTLFSSGIISTDVLKNDLPNQVESTINNPAAIYSIV